MHIRHIVIATLVVAAGCGSGPSSALDAAPDAVSPAPDGSLSVDGRLPTSGDLDLTFGENGVARCGFGRAGGLRFDGQGRILLLDSDPGTKATLCAFSGDGQSATTFGTDGKVEYIRRIGSFSRATLGLDSDGRPYVIGFDGADSDAGFIARFDSDGQPDTSYGTAGVVRVPDTVMTAGALDSTGRLVAIGNPELRTELRVLRFSDSGGADSTFAGGSGMFTMATTPGAFTATLQVEAVDKILVLGRQGDSTYLLRLDADGVLDKSFGTAGLLESTETRRSFLFDNQGRILTTGFASGPIGTASTRLVVSRLSPDGVLDEAFGVDGVALAATASSGYALAIDSQNRIVAAGVSPAGDGRIVVARFLEDGTPDEMFSAGGFRVLDMITPGGEAGEFVMLDASDRIYVAGTSNSDDIVVGSSGSLVVRVLP